jgi:hypothetical protein
MSLKGKLTSDKNKVVTNMGVSELTQLGGTLTSVTDFVKPSRILLSLIGRINVPYES